MTRPYMEYREIKEVLETNQNLILDMVETDYTGQVLLEIKEYPIYSYIRENEYLGDEEIERYYGVERQVSWEDKKDLIMRPFIRLILKHENIDQPTDFIVLNIVPFYISMGYQKVRVYPREIPQGEIKAWI